MNKKDIEVMEKLFKKVNTSSEEEFLKYLIDCCENVLESEKIMGEMLVEHGISHPIMMQLVKLRAEVTTRLEKIYKTKYGKFAKGDSLLAKLARAKV